MKEQSRYQFIKAEEAGNRQDRNYQRLISDCHESVQFLNRLPLGVLEESIEVFRNNLFSMTDRRQIPSKIYQIIEKELQAEKELDAASGTPMSSLVQLQNNGIHDLSQNVYHSLQIVLEFMDKGMKGMLTGDLSVYIIQQIQVSIEKSKKEFEEISFQIADLLEKQQSLREFYDTNFKIAASPSMEQEKFKNMDSYLYLLQKSDWKKHMQIKNSLQYISTSPSLADQQQSIKSQKTVQFLEPKNMQAFMEKKVEDFEKTQQDRLDYLKKEINVVINKLYNDVCQTALNLDKYRIPIHGIPNPQFENPVNLFQRQLKIEELSFELSQAKYKSQLDGLIKVGRADQLSVSHRYILSWMRLLESSINEQQKIFIKRGNLDPQKSKIGYYLIQMPSDKIATICVLHLMKHLFGQFIKDIRNFEDDENLQDREGENETSQEVKIPAIQLFDELGKLFDKELKQTLLQSKQSGKKSDERQPNHPNQEEMTAENQHLNISKQIQSHLISEDQHIGALPRDVQLKIGAFLTNLMCKNLKYKIGKKNYLLLKPQILKESSKKYLGYIIFNKSFIETFIGELDKIHDLSLQLERSLPMIYQPAPWKNFLFGGYYLKQTKMAKVFSHFGEAIRYLQKANLNQMCQVLDVLGSVKWRLNRNILEIIEYVWSIGGGLGEIPKRFNERQITPEMIKLSKFREKLKLLKEHQKNRETHSLRCEFLLRLSIAQSFKNINQIYFPHNMDFRGRVYPIPPHLNHMGADVNRGILEFAEGKPLGKDGLFWLKVHLANKIGQDKLPLKDRALYAESIMDKVHRCADDPKNNLEWLKSDNPWQTLGCMFDLSRAMRSEKPEEYLSHSHVHVDGSCNGMQHYAALGRDDRGARQVNLADSERPGDVYTAILKLVIQEMENEKDPTIMEVVESLKGNVSRKVIKQTVMTSVYGVTFIGARKQIQRQLKDKRLYETNGELYKAAQYLAKVTIKCIGDLFRDANRIKDWFAKCAKVIAGTGEPVKWMTPLGLPCVQPYKSVSKKSIITTIIQSLSVVDNMDNQPVNKSKQNTAFPPNYVHSLDSTHMMYTALECKKVGIIFAAVHDSFWGHAANITQMNEVLRLQFIKLHGSDLLETLYDNFIQRYPHEKFPEVPERGVFDLKEVKKSTYFFS